MENTTTQVNGRFTLGILWLMLVAYLFLMGCQKHEMGYIDSGRLFKEAARFQAVRDSLKGYSEKWNKEAVGLDSIVKQMAVELTEAQKKDSKFDSLLNRYNSKQHDLQRFVQASSEKARKMEAELMAPHLTSTNACLQKFLLKNKLTILLGTQQSGTILAGDPASDFTERALKFLNTQCKE